MWVFLKVTCLSVVNRPGFFVLQSVQICWKTMGLRVFALTMYHEHCFLVTETLSHSASLRPLHQAPGQSPSGLLQMWNVRQGRLATVFLFLLPLQDKGPYFPHIWLSFFFWVSGDVIKKCHWWRTIIRQLRGQHHVPGVSYTDLLDFTAPLSTPVEFEFQHLGLLVTTGPLFPEGISGPFLTAPKVEKQWLLAVP